MVNERIIETACVVYNCDYCVDKHSKSLHDAAKYLEEISGINPQGWSLMKIATALMMVCCPYQQLKTGHPGKIFSKEACVQLWNDALKYEGKIPHMWHVTLHLLLELLLMITEFDFKSWIAAAVATLIGHMDYYADTFISMHKRINNPNK
ncbi:hypothetical protein C2845_PM02G08570 [Panicum miliaceum]|uniref:Uncharacterized protein n=1 Tax=Panicum miliaceum TaxID=4540 RepID=A0A3L6S8A2_PANMI|nr:hypothetical protein C2845_PM02G08570 [Panicum miliaceum]